MDVNDQLGLLQAGLQACVLGPQPSKFHLDRARGAGLGPERCGSNDAWLSILARESTAMVAAWGNHGRLLGRGQPVRTLFPDCWCFGCTRQGEPRHPLYVPRSTSLVPVPQAYTLDRVPG